MTSPARLIVGLCLGTLCGYGAAQAQIGFEDVTSTAGPFHTGESWGASWGELNGDLYPDLYASNHKQRDSIYRNEGDGTFTDVTAQVDVGSVLLNDATGD
ncbi:MAG: VCBS repeat-containing protein, partial [Thiohalocapsa sp.]|nr:VCBS repeat-containing protein [Thiohalocapsa sp.]